MSNNKNEKKSAKSVIKTMNIRIPKDLWGFLKQASVDQEVSMNMIINKCLTKYKNKFDTK